jgi:XTP/dITP diphosphohydrolase
MAEPPLLEFLEVMQRLRAECPWKAEQTHRSLARYLLEETHETLEAIDTGDDAHLREELGDLLLQVYFHAVVAEERGAFTIDDVARDITAKMHRRNPHVFGAPGASRPDLTAAEVDEAWQAIKATEKRRASVTDGLPETLPALLYAAKVLERGGTEPIRLRPAAEDDPSDHRRIGERLLDLVAEAVDAGVDPEQALRDAVRRRPRAADRSADSDAGPSRLGGT